MPGEIVRCNAIMIGLNESLIEGEHVIILHYFPKEIFASKVF
jgi:hypothetical protein